MKKRIIALLLCLVMALSLLPTTVLATSADTAADAGITTGTDTTTDTDNNTDTDATGTDTNTTGTDTNATGTNATAGDNTTADTDATAGATTDTDTDTDATADTDTDTTQQPENILLGAANPMSATGPEVGDIVWIPRGSTVYKNLSDTEGYTLRGSYKVEITSDQTVNGERWLKYEYKDWSAIVGAFVGLRDYQYIKAAYVSTTDPDDDSDLLNNRTDSVTVGEGESALSVELKGIPEGVNASASVVAFKEIPSAVYEKIGSHKLVFRLDISLTKDGAEWQPDGGKVRVTVDVAELATKLKLKNGDLIGILHQHDDKVDELGEVVLADGKLSFKTDSFSSFYGYTVDFEYDGTWYSIGGGSSVFLYELFPALGIDRDDKAVSSITVSDDSLMVAENIVVSPYDGETAWQIRSLAPFQTAEEVRITFNDGSAPITINAYDANYTELYDNSTVNDGDWIGSIHNPVTIFGTVNLTLTGGTVHIGNVINIPAGATLNITGTGTLLWDKGNLNDGNMFNVHDGGKLSIQASTENGIIIDGDAKWSHTPVADSTRETVSVTQRADMTGSLIYVRDGTLDLKNVKIQNGHSMKQAVIDCQEVNNTTINYVTMDHVTVQHCLTTKSDASVVRLNGSIAKLTDCTFTENFAVGKYCGIIKSGGPDQFCQLTMKNCTATGNYSSGWGGVILWAANNTRNDGALASKAAIDSCTFTGNKARYLGGAISNEAVMEIKNTTIKNNIAMSGGGIATFPFTRTTTADKGDTACGLTLGTGNVIEDNTAYASEPFKPFHKVTTNTADGDEWKLENTDTATKIIEYQPGGGGIWAYQNKESWTFSLTVGEGNTIQNNTANGNGGGIEIYRKLGDTTTLNITGATIKNNKAVNGGGVYTAEANVTISAGTIENNTASGWGGGIGTTHGTCTVSGDGTIKNNTACNGGGVAIVEGAINVSGGIITGNEAKGTFTGDTTKVKLADVQGVGGGVYVYGTSTKESTFKLEGTKIGIYGNKADVAAADVYANGKYTTLTLPAVKDMDLTGMKGVHPTGWYADYKADDTNYPQSVIGKENPGRYDADDTDNVEVTYEVGQNNKKAFYCLTLGIPHTDGNLTITKKVSEAVSENQTFIFKVTGTTAGSGDDGTGKSYSMTVAILLEKGKTEASVTVAHIPNGTYTVKELTNWSWRYDEQSHTFYPKGEPSSTAPTITVNAEKPNWCADFLNRLSNGYWLSGDCYAENHWSKVTETTPAEKDPNADGTKNG